MTPVTDADYADHAAAILTAEHAGTAVASASRVVVAVTSWFAPNHPDVVPAEPPVARNATISVVTLDRAYLDLRTAPERVRRYFEDGYFSGAQFERWHPPSKRDQNRVTGDDLLALSLLGVPVSGQAVLSLLGPRSTDIASALRQIPVNEALWATDIEDLHDEAGPAVRLWRTIRDAPDMGPTRTSKLLARKRPLLFPVHDSVVEGALGPSSGHWRRVHQLVSNPAMLARLTKIRDRSGVGDDISLLRILDVAIWMKDTGDAQLAKARSRRAA